MKLTVRPLTPDLWPALENLFGVPSASFAGFVSTFARAGFTVAARHTASRPTMRHDLKAITRTHS